MNHTLLILMYKATMFVAIVQSLSHVQLFVTPWTAALQASLSFTITQSLLNLMSIESVMTSNHLIFCHPRLLLSSIFPSIRVFSNESALHRLGGFEGAQVWLRGATPGLRLGGGS